MKKLLLLIVFLVGFAATAGGTYLVLSRAGETTVTLLDKKAKVKESKLPKIGQNKERSTANKLALPDEASYLVDDHNAPIRSGEKWELKKIDLASAEIKNVMGLVLFEVKYQLEVDVNKEGGVVSFSVSRKSQNRPNFLVQWKSYLEVKSLGRSKRFIQRNRGAYKDYQVDLYLYRKGAHKARHVMKKIRVKSDGTAEVLSS